MCLWLYGPSASRSGSMTSFRQWEERAMCNMSLPANHLSEQIKNALCFASSRGWLAKRGPSSASARSLAPQLFGPTIVSSLRCTAVAPGKTDQALKASLAGAPGILRPISIPGSLAEDGIVSVPVDTEMVDEMVEMFEQLRKTTGNRFRRCGPVEAPVSRAGARENVLWTEQIPCDVEASNFRLTDGPREVYDV